MTRPAENLESISGVECKRTRFKIKVLKSFLITFQVDLYLPVCVMDKN